MGEQLGRYLLEKKLAAGGMAEIFLARPLEGGKLGQACVIKRMLPAVAADTTLVRMFLDEARLIAQLNHPNVARVLDFGEDKGVIFLAMEYVHGANLRAIVKENARERRHLPFTLAARLISQAALALDHAHAAVGLDGTPLKIIHRDVSPQNLLLSIDGEVKLIDFGVAKSQVASQKTATGLIKGKFAYMSPEQIRGKPLDGRSDLFGLGLVLYELLTNERAVPGDNDADIATNSLNLAIEPIERKRRDTPIRLRGLINKALDRDREHRFQTGTEMSAALEAFIAESGQAVAAHHLVELLRPFMEVPDRPRLESQGSARPIAVVADPRDKRVSPFHLARTLIDPKLAPRDDPSTVPTDKKLDMAPIEMPPRTHSGELVKLGIRKSRLPWVFVGVALGLAGAVGYWLWAH